MIAQAGLPRPPRPRLHGGSRCRQSSPSAFRREHLNTRGPAKRSPYDEGEAKERKPVARVLSVWEKEKKLQEMWARQDLLTKGSQAVMVDQSRSGPTGTHMWGGGVAALQVHTHGRSEELGK